MPRPGIQLNELLAAEADVSGNKIDVLARIEAVWGKDSPEYAGVVGLIETGQAFFDAQAALDNHECAGTNAPNYEYLMRSRNAARRDFDDALACVRV